jgi:hypothetical protein
MIGRGRHNEILIFEMTEQDLLDGGAFPSTYQAGNVLLFDSNQDIQIGLELARADDLACALEFLGEQPDLVDKGVAAGQEGAAPIDEADPQGASGSLATEKPSQPSPILSSRYLDAQEEVRLLNQRIEQRDGLLSEMVEKLRLQREENELLSLLLEQTTSQLALDAASRDELLDDLQLASANTMLIETNLEHVMEERFQLEQELAEKITDLIETSMVNDDLRRRLDSLTEPSLEAGDMAPEAQDDWAWLDDCNALAGLASPSVQASPCELPASHSRPAPGEPRPLPLPGPIIASEPDVGQVVTMSGGKQIHIYHEFPSLNRRSLGDRTLAFGRTLSRIVAALLLIAALTLAASVIATSLINDISYGQALDLILKNTLRVAGQSR